MCSGSYTYGYANRLRRMFLGSMVVKADGQSALTGWTICHVGSYGKLIWLEAMKEGETTIVLLTLGNSEVIKTSHGSLTVTRTRIITSDELLCYMAPLGPDVFSTPLTMTYLRNYRLNHPNAQIGTQLLKQTFVAGTTNELRAEILHSAGLSPFVRFGAVTENELVRLHTSIVSLFKRVREPLVHRQRRVLGGEVRSDVLGGQKVYYMQSD